MAFSHGWLSLMSFFHLSDWQTNPAVLCSVWLWPANICYVYLPSLVQGTYYSLKPLSVTGSQSLDKKALSVEWVNRRQNTQTCRHYNLHHFQESEEMLLRVPFQAAVYPQPPHLSSKPFLLRKRQHLNTLMQCQNMYFCLEFHCIFANILNWRQERLPKVSRWG